MRILKLVGVGLVVIVGLLVVAAVVLVSLFDPNDYKPEITAVLEERSGRSVAIADDIEWSLFPWLAIETGGVTIGDRPDFAERPFAEIESLSARVRVWPLLRRRVELGLIAVEGIELNLGIDADGRPNWSDLLAAEGEPGETGAGVTSAGGGLASLQIEGIRVGNGRILWREGDEVRYVISDLSLRTGPIALGDPVDIELALSALEVATQRSATLDLETIATVRGNRTRLIELGADIALRDAQGTERGTARIEADGLAVVDGSRIEIGTGRLDGTATDPPFGPPTVDGQLRWSAIELDLAAGTASADGVTTSINGVTANWTLAATNLSTGATFQGNAVLPPAPAERVLAVARMALPGAIDPATLGTVGGRADFTFAPGDETSLQNLELSALGMDLTGSARVGTDAIAQASFSIPSFAPNDALRSLLATYLPAGTDLSAIETVALTASIETDVTGSGTTTIDGLQLRINGAALSADMEIAQADAGATYSGSATATDVDPALLAALLGDRLASGLDPAAIGTSAARTRFVFAAADDTLTLEELSAQAFGLSASGRATINALSTAPVARGRAQIATFDPRALLTRFDQPVPQTSDPDAFRSAAFAGDFVVDAAHAEFRGMTVTLDGSPIMGSVGVDEFDAPSYRFELSTPTLDVDRYLPPESDEAEQDERQAGDIGLEREPLELIDLTGTARIGALRLADLDFQQVEATLRIGGGRARIEPAHAELYGGEFDGALAVDATGEASTMQLTGQATALALEPLLTALTGDSVIRGTGTFDLDLRGMGATVTETLQTAAGTMSFAFTDGAIAGFNVGRALCAAYNLREGLPQPARAPDETRFQLIRAGADVRDGIASSSDLLARTGFMDITGSGRMSLPDARLDYDMKATLTAAVPIEGCQTMNEFVGDSIPFTIEGPISDPDIEPDLRQIVRERVRESVEDRLRDRLQDRLRDLL